MGQAQRYPYQDEAKGGDQGGGGGAPDAAAAAAAAAGGDGKGGDGKGGEGEFTSGNWRATMAGEDAKALAKLERYSTPKDVANALLSVQERISRGELRSTLPKNATAEQVTAWRAENGIPDAPEKYELKLRDGFVIGDEDKPLVNNFLAEVYKGGADLNSTQASKVVDAYYQVQEVLTAQRATQDAQLVQEATDALNVEFGAEFRPNMNRLSSLLDMAPPGVKEKLLAGRTAEGKPMTGDADMVRWLVSLAREINPITTNVGDGAGGNMANAIADQIDAIEKTMREDRKKYDGDEKMQERYRELLTAREKIKAKE